MKPLLCLTPFLETGKKFKLPAGETYDALSQSQQGSALVEEPPSRKARRPSPAKRKPEADPT